MLAELMPPHEYQGENRMFRTAVRTTLSRALDITFELEVVVLSSEAPSDGKPIRGCGVRDLATQSGKGGYRESFEKSIRSEDMSSSIKLRMFIIPKRSYDLCKTQYLLLVSCLRLRCA